MPLNPQLLKEDLYTYMDEQSPTFAGYLPSEQAFAARFSQSILTYLSQMIPPNLVLTTLSANTNLILTAIQSRSFHLQFDNYLIQTSTSMLTLFPGFTSTPPILVNSTVPIFITNPEKTSKQFIDLLVTAIDTYFRTGVAVNISSGVAIPWS